MRSEKKQKAIDDRERKNLMMDIERLNNRARIHEVKRELMAQKAQKLSEKLING